MIFYSTNFGFIYNTCCRIIIISLIILYSSCAKDSSSPPANNRIFYSWTQFAMGADLSYVNAVEDHGGMYKDSGVVKDPFLIFKNHGANIVRVRLWHNPQCWPLSTTGNYIAT